MVSSTCSQFCGAERHGLHLMLLSIAIDPIVEKRSHHDVASSNTMLSLNSERFEQCEAAIPLSNAQSEATMSIKRCHQALLLSNAAAQSTRSLNASE